MTVKVSLLCIFEVFVCLCESFQVWPFYSLCFGCLWKNIYFPISICVGDFLHHVSGVALFASIAMYRWALESMSAVYSSWPGTCSS